MGSLRKIFLLALLSVGCESLPKTPPSPPKAGNRDTINANIRVQSTGLDSASAKVDSIQSHASEIIKNIDSARGVLATIDIPIPIEIQSQAEKTFASIIAESNMIRYESETMKRDFELIRDEHEIIQEMGNLLDVQATRINYLENEAERLRNTAIEGIYKYLVWVFGLGFLVIIGGSIVAFFVNKKLGTYILAIGIITLGFGAAATFYLKWIAITGFVVVGVGILSTIALLVYGMIEDTRKKNKLEREKTALEQANTENVRLIDATKKKLTEDSKEAIFGTGGIADTVQNSETKKIVASIRGKNDSSSTLA